MWYSGDPLSHRRICSRRGSIGRQGGTAGIYFQQLPMVSRHGELPAYLWQAWRCLLYVVHAAWVRVSSEHCSEVTWRRAGG